MMTCDVFATRFVLLVHTTLVHTTLNYLYIHTKLDRHSQLQVILCLCQHTLQVHVRGHGRANVVAGELLPLC
jgi:hypothetical protein